MDFAKAFSTDLEEYITNPQYSVRDQLTALTVYRARPNCRLDFLFDLCRGAVPEDAFAQIALEAACTIASKRGNWDALVNVMFDLAGQIWIKQTIAAFIVACEENVPNRYLGAIIDHRESDWHFGDRGNEFARGAAAKVQNQWTINIVH